MSTVEPPAMRRWLPIAIALAAAAPMRPASPALLSISFCWRCRSAASGALGAFGELLDNRTLAPVEPR